MFGLVGALPKFLLSHSNSHPFYGQYCCFVINYFGGSGVTGETADVRYLNSRSVHRESRTHHTYFQVNFCLSVSYFINHSFHL